MKVLAKSKTPEGTSIQLEDWDGKLYIGAYPVARNSSKYGWIRNNSIFRLTIASNSYMNYTNENVLEDYENLKTGVKVLSDLKEHYWHGKKDQYFMGLTNEEPRY